MQLYIFGESVSVRACGRVMFVFVSAQKTERAALPAIFKKLAGPSTSGCGSAAPFARQFGDCLRVSYRFFVFSVLAVHSY